MPTSRRSLVPLMPKSQTISRRSTPSGLVIGLFDAYLRMFRGRVVNFLFFHRAYAGFILSEREPGR